MESDWHLVYKAHAGNDVNPYTEWTENAYSTRTPPGVENNDGNNYFHPLVAQWNTIGINQVTPCLNTLLIVMVLQKSEDFIIFFDCMAAF